MKYLPYGENLVKIGQVNPEIILSQMIYFLNNDGGARRRPY